MDDDEDFKQDNDQAAQVEETPQEDLALFASPRGEQPAQMQQAVNKGSLL